MRHARTLLLVTVLLLGGALPVLATEDTPAETTETTTAPGETEVTEFDYEPAVVLPEEPAAEVEQPWTTKFLVPTGLLLAAVALVATIVMYFVRVVRTRYKVVE